MFCSTELRTETQTLRMDESKMYILTCKAGVTAAMESLDPSAYTCHLACWTSGYLLALTKTENISWLQNSNPAKLWVSGGPLFSVLKVILGVEGAHLEARGKKMWLTIASHQSIQQPKWVVVRVAKAVYRILLSFPFTESISRGCSSDQPNGLDLL